jgi:hypothetical protein
VTEEGSVNPHVEFLRFNARATAALLVNRIMLIGLVWIFWGWLAGLVTFVILQMCAKWIGRNLFIASLEDLNDCDCGSDHKP